MRGRFRGTAARLLVLLILPAGLAASGCGAFDDTVQATPKTSSRPSLNTMEASAVGDRLTLTAVVTGVSSSQSFTVQDADLPERGLLVLGPAAVRTQDLVTVTGVVDLFTYAGFRERFRLADHRVYHRFESRKVLIADEVRSWAGPRRS